MAETITTTITRRVELDDSTNPLTITDTGGIVTAYSIAVYGGSGVVGTVTNAGTVSSLNFGVFLNGGGSVANTGTTSAITGTDFYGVYVRGGAGTVTNAGTVSGYSGGVRIYAAGSVANTGTASVITATGTNGIGIYVGGYVGGGLGTVTNAGTVSGGNYGVYLQRGGSVANTGTASVINGTNYDGIFVRNVGSVTNAGTVSGGQDGVELIRGGSVANTGTASVITATGTNGSGIYVYGGASTVTNAGTITGATAAIQFRRSFDDRVVLDPGAVLNGAVLGGSGTNTLELSGTAGQAGTLAGFSSQFSGFGTIAVDTGADWTLAAGQTIGAGVTIADAGTLELAGTVGQAGTLAAQFTGYGTIAVDAGADWTLAAGNTIGAGVTITDAGTLTNAGSVGSTVTLLPGAGLLANTGAIVTGSYYGVYGGSGVVGTVTNAGTVSGGNAGVFLRGGGSVANTGTASAITGTGPLGTGPLGTGIAVGGGLGTVTNAGTVSGHQDGVFLGEGGSVANTGTASVITGTNSIGIEMYGVGAVTNAGTVSGFYDGVYFQAGGSVANTGTASTITGTGTNGIGISLDRGGTVTNAGTITGASAAIQFSGGFADRVVLDPGAVLNGAVLGGSGTNTLELAGTAGQAGTLSTFGSQFTGFGTIAVDTGADWTLAAGNTIGAGVMITDAGTLTNAGSIGSTVTLLAGAGVLTNTGAIVTGSNYGVYVSGGAGTVTNAGTVSGTITGVALGGGGSVANTGTASAITGTGTSSTGIRIGYGTVTNAGTVSGGNTGVGLGDGGSVANTGTASLITGTNGVGIYVSGVAGTVTNAGTVSGGSSGVYFRAGGSVANTGTSSAITSTNGVGIAEGGAGTVTNAGTITGATAAIQFSGAYDDRVVLDPGAVLNGAVLGGSGTNTLELAGTAGQVGTLSTFDSQFTGFGTIAVDTGADWTLAAGNTIGAGVTITDAGTLTNAGSVASTVTLLTGAGVFANTGAIATTANAGVAAALGVAGTVTNAGTISGSDDGVVLAYGGSVANIGTASLITGATGIEVDNFGTATNAGTVSGVDNGVFIEYATLVNTGTVSGGNYGVYLRRDGIVDNFGTASVITGTGTRGVGVLLGDAGTLTNAGTVSGSRYGVYLSGGTVANIGTASVITGTGNAGVGVYGAYAAGTVTNAGTITGTRAAIQFVGSYDDRVVLDPGAVLNGAVLGGSGTNTLELSGTAGQAGTLAGFASQFSGFGTIAVDAGASWTLAGTGETITAGIALGSTLTAAESGTVALAGAVSGAGGLVAAGTELDLDAANSFSGGVTVAAGTLDVAALEGAGTGAVGFAAGVGGATLAIEGAALGGTGTGQLSFGNLVSGFAAGDVLDLRSIGNAQASFDYATDVLSLTDAAGTTTTLQLAGNFSGERFIATADPSGTGTDVTLAAATAPAITGTHATADSAEGTVAPFGASGSGPAVTITDANAGATDSATIALSGGGGTLSGTGLTQNPDGSYTLAASSAAGLTQELDALSFTPANSTPNATATTVFQLAVTSSAGPSAADGGTQVSDTATAVAPVITGTHATADTAEGTVAPFAGVALSDPNRGTNTLTIALRNGGGTLSGAGLVANADGTYTLAGSAATVTSALDALSFTPAAPPPGTSATTSFVLSDTTAAGTSVTDAGTSVTDTAAAAPPPNPTPDTVSFDASAAYAGHGTFVLTGTATSPAGVKSVEISAMVDGVETDLGAATVNADGTFTDHVGPHVQGSITATATDTAGGTVSATAPFDLQAGLRGIPGQPYQAVETLLDAGGNPTLTTYFERDGSVLFSSTQHALPNGGSSFTYSNGAFFDDKPYSSFSDIYRPDGELAAVHELDNTSGSHTLLAENSGVTLHSQYQDTMIGIGTSDRFVFTTGYGHDTVENFNLSGPHHDTLSLPSSDFASLGQVLHDTRDTAAGATIRDPSSGDRITVAGITKAELIAHPKDIAFHT